MSIIDRIAERHIQQAQQRGELDNLPGQGKPLNLDDDSMVPKALRAGYRLLKNSGFLPPELQLNKEIREVEQLLNQVSEGAARDRAERRLRFLQMQLSNLRGDGIDLMAERQYRDRLRDKL